MTKQDWSEKYSAALSETNRSLLPVRIDEAQKAMVERSREIPETSQERQRLNYAINLLSLLRDLEEKNDLNSAARGIKRPDQTLKIGNGKTGCSLGVSGEVDFSLPPFATQKPST